MALILRRSNADHHDPKERERMWSVLHEGLYVGSINELMGASDQPRYWFWVIHIHAGRHSNGVRQATACDGRTATRATAMSAFRTAFEKYLAHIGPEGWIYHVEHMAELASRSGKKRY